jgi:hypothetical protein
MQHHMTSSQLEALLIGAAVAFLPTLFLEWWRSRRAMATRWDGALQQTCREFTASARRLQHHAERRGDLPDAAALDEAIDGEHAMLRTLCEQIHLSGSKELQKAAKMVVRHGYALRLVAEGRPDPRATEFPGRAPRERFVVELTNFYIAARRQLGVRNPEEMADIDSPA